MPYYTITDIKNLSLQETKNCTKKRNILPSSGKTFLFFTSISLLKITAFLHYLYITLRISPSKWYKNGTISYIWYKEQLSNPHKYWILFIQGFHRRDCRNVSFEISTLPYKGLSYRTFYSFHNHASLHISL